LINLSFADRLLAAGLPWYLAGLSGLAISSVWNYGVNTIVTWRRTRESNSPASVTLWEGSSIDQEQAT